MVALLVALACGGPEFEDWPVGGDPDTDQDDQDDQVDETSVWDSDPPEHFSAHTWWPSGEVHATYAHEDELLVFEQQLADEGLRCSLSWPETEALSWTLADATRTTHLGEHELAVGWLPEDLAHGRTAEGTVRGFSYAHVLDYDQVHEVGWTASVHTTLEIEEGPALSILWELREGGAPLFLETPDGRVWTAVE